LPVKFKFQIFKYYVKGKIHEKKKYMPALIKAEIGIVNIQAQKIFLVTPHLTADKPFLAPTPIIAPVIV